MAISSTFAVGSRNFQLFTSSGTFTPPSGAKVFDVIVVGAGGGGSGGGYADGGTITTGYGGAGGGSGYAMYLRDLRITSPVTVTIGVGGAGGIGALASVAAWSGLAGTRGGTTAFGAYTAAGGGGAGVTTTGSAAQATASLSSNLAAFDTIKSVGYVPSAGASSAVILGGSGGSAGGYYPSTAPTRSSAGTSSITSTGVGAIWGGSNFNSLTPSSESILTTVSFDSQAARTQSIIFGQQFGQILYLSREQSNGQYYVDARTRKVGDLWYVAGGGGVGLSVTTTTLYGQGGFAGTDIAGGSHGVNASATVISQVGETATTPSAGGGGGGGSYQTGAAAGAGGAGANGFVVVYW